MFTASALPPLGFMERTYCGYGEMEGQGWTLGGRSPYRWSATRDAAGRIIHRMEIIDGETIGWDYSYDDLGRLTDVTKNGVLAEHYTYDANGNRLAGDNALLGIVGTVYSYSAEDHLLTAGANSYQFDMDGFLQSSTTAAGTASYSYSSRGELQTAWLPDGHILSYVHDPLGRRIAKTIDGTTVEKYLWADQTKLLAVYDGSNNLKARFIYADERMPVAMASGGVTYTLAYDQVGTLRTVSDASGSTVKRIDYDSFGNIVADSNPALIVPFGFAGGLHDRDMGLVRFGYRDYSPELGRFTAKDPIDFAGGDTNLYAYVSSDPVNMIDMRGLDPQSPGCDMIPDLFETACRKRACDVHDRCYERYNCDVGSWKPGKGSPECKKCNGQVWSDFSKCAIPEPGDRCVPLVEYRF